MAPRFIILALLVGVANIGIVLADGAPITAPPGALSGAGAAFDGHTLFAQAELHEHTLLELHKEAVDRNDEVLAVCRKDLLDDLNEAMEDARAEYAAWDASEFDLEMRDFHFVMLQVHVQWMSDLVGMALECISGQTGLGGLDGIRPPSRPGDQGNRQPGAADGLDGILQNRQPVVGSVAPPGSTTTLNPAMTPPMATPTM